MTPRWGEFKAVEWGTVTVQAGTFKALRIQEFQRGFSSEYWWAPSVRQSVKIDTSANWHSELVSFELKTPKTK